MPSGVDKILLLEGGAKVNVLRTKAHYLQQLFWECTLRCNLNCKHCGSSCNTRDNRGEMPLRDFLPVLDEIRASMSHPILVITTGGEPLLRTDILQCGKEITRRGFYWGIVTNGSYLNDTMLRALVDSGLKSISVSVDGNRDDHNWMRGSDMSFDKVIDAVDLLSSQNLGLTWDVITCVNKRNLAHLEELKQLLIAHGVKSWKLFAVFPMGRAEDNAETMMLDRDELIALMDFISESRKRGGLKITYGCESFLGRYEYEVRNQQFFCAAGVNVASIRYNGAISGCLSIRHNYDEGNIYTDSFVDTWENGFEQYRISDWKRTGVCEKCEVWRWCQGGAMHLRDDNRNLKRCDYRMLYHGQD